MILHYICHTSYTKCEGNSISRRQHPLDLLPQLLFDNSIIILVYLYNNIHTRITFSNTVMSFVLTILLRDQPLLITLSIHFIICTVWPMFPSSVQQRSVNSLTHWNLWNKIKISSIMSRSTRQAWWCTSSSNYSSTLHVPLHDFGEEETLVLFVLARETQ